MQRWRITLIIIGIILIASAIAFETYTVTQRYLISKMATATTQCTSAHATVRIIISHTVVMPLHSTGSLCDKLVITNLDNTVRLIAFGTHTDHQPYDGVAERLLGQGQSLTLTLDQSGSFKFHDHLHDIVAGTFTVK